MRKYQFDWAFLGDIASARPNLGDKIGLDTYRLLLFTMRDVLEKKYGSDETDSIMFEAGKIAGKNFFEHFIAPVSSLEEFVSKTQQILREKGIGVLKIEDVQFENGKILLAVDEDVDCSGLPETSFEVCIYDEGFISALFEGFTDEPWTAKEVDCWCTGARTCRFLVQKD